MTGEPIILMAVIDTKEGKDVATLDILYAFMQTKIPEKEHGELS